MSSYTERMRSKLEAAFAPQELELIDDSRKHAGHAGAHPEGETHFRLRIIAQAFEGMSRVERQRRIHSLLAEELQERVHALSIEARSPAEATTKGGN